MEGDKRRTEIVQILKERKQPITGTALAKTLGVSRQVIVQDIALLRATNKDILATNKGYILFQEKEEKGKARRAVKVKHQESDILDELYTIVDLGGRLRNVVVEHAIYGQILVDLIINSREDALNFVEEVKQNKTKPLTELTDGVHVHTIEADSEEVLDKITQKLAQKGYLIK